MASIELSEAALEEVAHLPDEGPVVLLNLLRFKGEAGRASFETYLEHARPIGRPLHNCLREWEPRAAVSRPLPRARVRHPPRAGAPPRAAPAAASRRPPPR